MTTSCRVTRVVRPIAFFTVVVLVLAACWHDGDDDNGGNGPEPSTSLTSRFGTTTTLSRTTTTVSALAQLLQQRTPGDETYSPIIADFLLSFGSQGRTREQVVADALTPYSSRTVTADAVTQYVSIGCAGPPDRAANHLQSMIDRATPFAARAVKQAVDLLAASCTWSRDGINANENKYLNDVSNYLAAYVLTRPLPRVSASLPTTTTLPAPSTGAAADLYKAACAFGSTAAGAASWYQQLKQSRGGWLGLAFIAAGFTYCPQLLQSVLG